MQPFSSVAVAHCVRSARERESTLCSDLNALMQRLECSLRSRKKCSSMLRFPYAAIPSVAVILGFRAYGHLGFRAFGHRFAPRPKLLMQPFAPADAARCSRVASLRSARKTSTPVSWEHFWNFGYVVGIFVLLVGIFGHMVGIFGRTIVPIRERKKPLPVRRR